MQIMKKTAAVLAIGTMLAGCAEQTSQNARQGGVAGGAGMSKADIGTGLGAVGGAVAGYQFGGGRGKAVGVALGTLLGAGVGRAIGGSLDRADMAYYGQVQQTALETGQPGQTLPWSNPQTGNSGSFTPQAYYQNPTGQYCREFSQTVTVGGQVERAYGTACRQPDGQWQIVSAQ